MIMGWGVPFTMTTKRWLTEATPLSGAQIKILNPGQTSGQWAVGSGQWAVGSGQWAVGSGISPCECKFCDRLLTEKLSHVCLSWVYYSYKKGFVDPETDLQQLFGFSGSTRFTNPILHCLQDPCMSTMHVEHFPSRLGGQITPYTWPSITYSYLPQQRTRNHQTEQTSKGKSECKSIDPSDLRLQI